MASGSAARLLANSEAQDLLFAPGEPNIVNINPLTVLIVTPTLQAGAADLGAIDLVRILARSGNRPIVVSRGMPISSTMRFHPLVASTFPSSSSCDVTSQPRNSTAARPEASPAKRNTGNNTRREGITSTAYIISSVCISDSASAG